MVISGDRPAIRLERNLHPDWLSAIAGVNFNQPKPPSFRRRVPVVRLDDASTVGGRVRVRVRAMDSMRVVRSGSTRSSGQARRDPQATRPAGTSCRSPALAIDIDDVHSGRARPSRWPKGLAQRRHRCTLTTTLGSRLLGLGIQRVPTISAAASRWPWSTTCGAAEPESTIELAFTR